MTISTFRPSVVIPTYDNPKTIRTVVEEVRRHLPEVIVVDDGSGPEGRAILDDLAAKGLIHLHRRQMNGGKGTAVQDGLRVASTKGFTHALQVDADGQHDLDDVPTLLAAAAQNPDALILGEPLFDDSAPKARRFARKISQFWVDLETGGRVVHDPLCGFRVYPISAALATRPRARHMGHDPEIAVKMYWNGASVVNLPTRVRYLTESEGGVSHYRLFWDNVEMSWTHARLSNQLVPRLVLRWLGLRRASR